MATRENTRKTAAEKYTKDWPVIWRVVAPAAGSYDHDMVFLETDCRDKAIKSFRSLRGGNWPVRIEEVRCGPLPDGYTEHLAKIRSLNGQNPGTSMREIPGAWCKQPKSRAGGVS